MPSFNESDEKCLKKKKKPWSEKRKILATSISHFPNKVCYLTIAGIVFQNTQSFQFGQVEKRELFTIHIKKKDKV